MPALSTESSLGLRRFAAAACILCCFLFSCACVLCPSKMSFLLHRSKARALSNVIFPSSSFLKFDIPLWRRPPRCPLPTGLLDSCFLSLFHLPCFSVPALVLLGGELRAVHEAFSPALLLFQRCFRASWMYLDGIGLPHSQLLHVHDLAGVAIDAPGALWRLRMLRPQLRQHPGSSRTAQPLGSVLPTAWAATQSLGQDASGSGRPALLQYGMASVDRNFGFDLIPFLQLSKPVRDTASLPADRSGTSTHQLYEMNVTTSRTDRRRCRGSWARVWESPPLSRCLRAFAVGNVPGKD